MGPGETVNQSESTAAPKNTSSQMFWGQIVNLHTFGMINNQFIIDTDDTDV